MVNGQTICVFSLSKSDPTFRSVVSVVGAIKWLEGKKEEPHRYFFNEKKPKNGLPFGSKILFSFDGLIFGEATVKEGIKELSYDAKYKSYLTLDPSSIHIYRFYPSKEELSERIGIHFAQLFTYIKVGEYDAIIEIANRPIKVEG